jgi:hypothetical protein
MYEITYNVLTYVDYREILWHKVITITIKSNFLAISHTLQFTTART